MALAAVRKIRPENTSLDLSSFKRTVDDLITKTINEIATAITFAVEQQGAATAEVSSNIIQVSEASTETDNMTAEDLKAAAELSEQGAKLKVEIDDFLKSD